MLLIITSIINFQHYNHIILWWRLSTLSIFHPLWLSINGQSMMNEYWYIQWPFQDPIDWRYLPYIRPIFQAYVREYPPKKLAKHIWVNYNELTTSSLEIIVSKGNHPQMAEQFRLVNYYNLPRHIYHPFGNTIYFWWTWRWEILLFLPALTLLVNYCNLPRHMVTSRPASFTFPGGGRRRERWRHRAHGATDQRVGFSERRWWNGLGLVMFSCLDKYKLVCRSLELHLILGFYSNISTAGMQKPTFFCIGVGPPASLKAAKIRMRFNWSASVIESSTWSLKLPIVGHHHRDPLFWPWFFLVKKVGWWSAVQKKW